MSPTSKSSKTRPFHPSFVAIGLDNPFLLPLFDRGHIEAELGEDCLAMLAYGGHAVHPRLDTLHPNRRNERGNSAGGGAHGAPGVASPQLRVLDELLDGIETGVRNLRRF